jgi:hypothetical protein
MMLIDKVKTIDGTIAIRKDCRYIKGEYYIKNVQCFYIEDKWYRINSELIIYDNEKKEYLLSKYKDSLKHGIINFDSTGRPIFGYFSQNIFKNAILLLHGDQLYCIDYSLLLKNGYVEVPSKKYFVEKKEYHPASLMYDTHYYDNIRIAHGTVFNHSMFSSYRNDYFNKNSIKIINSDVLTNLYDFSWGIEFETIHGIIPERDLFKWGLIPLRDGSISGFEYATLPMYKEEVGLVKKYCDLLNENCKTDYHCSLHVHIGGYNRSEESILALYLLNVAIEEEMYSMFPSWIKHTSKVKGKDYCNPLTVRPRILSNRFKTDIRFNDLYKLLSGGEQFENFRDREHPMDEGGDHKWQIPFRYVYCNIIPLLFGSRHTVEYRIHTTTFNSNKIYCWMLILNAILKYASLRSDKIVKSTPTTLSFLKLIDILSYVYEDKEIVKILYDYINYRKSIAAYIDNDYNYEIKAGDIYPKMDAFDVSIIEK